MGSEDLCCPTARSNQINSRKKDEINEKNQSRHRDLDLEASGRSSPANVVHTMFPSQAESNFQENS
jgi:hypothetical protein